MSWGNALLMKLSNDVEKYEIEVTKMGQNYSFFSQWGMHKRPPIHKRSNRRHPWYANIN